MKMSTRSSRRARSGLVLLSIVAVVGSLTVGLMGTSGAQEVDTLAPAQGEPCTAEDVSDARADCVQGNFPSVPTNDNCLTRFGAANEFYVDPPKSATSPDNAVTGTVTNEGTTLNVSAAPGWIITGVVVKGGPNFNAYQPPVSDMISPLVGQGNIPEISHYVICYDSAGTISVQKLIEDPSNVALAADEFVMLIDCEGEAYDQDIVLTVAAPGPTESDQIPAGSACVVSEKRAPGTTALVKYVPDGGTPTTPPTVTVKAGATVAVAVTNRYTALVAKVTFTG
jgi:hypothetical protein